MALQQTIAAVPGHNLVSALQQVVDALVPALPADVATLRLLDTDAKLHLVAASGLRPAETRRLALDPITPRRLETMLDAGRHLLPRSLGLHWVEVRWLEAQDNRFGILTIGARSKRRPPENDLTRRPQQRSSATPWRRSSGARSSFEAVLSRWPE